MLEIVLATERVKDSVQINSSRLFLTQTQMLAVCTLLTRELAANRMMVSDP
jgi:hypothetical protein